MNPAEEGFDWQKVEAARRFLYALKPWWARYGNHFKIVPIDVPPRIGEPFGATTSTDQGMRLYIDRTFVNAVSLEVLAGSLEHEWQHHLRDSWNRLTHLSPEDWRRWANIAYDLEINSAISTEAHQLSIGGGRGKMESVCSKSSLFSVTDLDRWNVRSPPNVDEVGWLPSKIGAPDGLSAEEYLKLLMSNAQKEDESSSSDESSADNKGDNRSGTELPEKNIQPGNGSRQNDQDNQRSESSSDGSDSLNRHPSCNHEKPSSGIISPEGSSQEQAGCNDEQEQRDNQDHYLDSSGEKGDQASKDSENNKSGQNPERVDPVENQSSSDGSDGSDNDPSDVDLESDSTPSGSPSQNGLDNSGCDVQLDINAIDDLRRTPGGSWHSRELSNPKDPLSVQNWKPSEKDNQSPVGPGSASEALRELEEDVFNAKGNLAYVTQPANHLVKWARSRRKLRGLDWESRFNRLASSLYRSAKISGASDLSYSVRNPNQQELGPVLMGLHDYAPKIVVIQDVSGSMLMNDGMRRSQEAFTDLCTKTMGRFGTKVTWITVDTDIVAVGEASSFNREMEASWSKGFGGTRIGDLIDQFGRGAVRWKHRTIPKPDLLIVSTDCVFRWPKNRPRGLRRILVVSVSDDKTVSRWLPDWLNMRREYLVVDQ